MGILDWFKRPKLVIPAADPPKQRQRLIDLDIAKRLPKTAAKRLIKLGLIYDEMEIEFPHLKDITFAQWCIESAWGNSRAAREEWNFAGMKWGPSDKKYGAVPSKKSGFDGYEHGVRYSHFPEMQQFIRAYWGRLDNVSAYHGWREHTASPTKFIQYVGPTWVGYEADKYVSNVISTWKKYTEGLFP